MSNLIVRAVVTSFLLRAFLSGIAVAFFHSPLPTRAGPLEDYVQNPDPSFQWKQTEQKKTTNGTLTHLELISQSWRGQFWSHHLQVYRPNVIRNPDIAYLMVSGDGEGGNSLGLLEAVGGRGGAIAAVLTKVPNQPLYDGRKEDALIAFTFDQYIKTGERDWPLLFPMAKSAVRALDTLEAYAHNAHGQQIKRFVVGGGSKRGWTTWLTGAIDSRVVAIAPMVIDMLNMKTQTDWAQKMYGRQSEQIRDYTDLDLIARMDDPGMVELRAWVDPYSYRARYTLPKLLLLGTNDPYWVVDSLRHYWNDLPDPKLVFQTPNAGHDLAGGKEAIPTLAAWFQMIADHQKLPAISWAIQNDPGLGAKLTLRLNRPAKQIRLWTAESSDRDFRDETWTNRELPLESDGCQATAQIDEPTRGYRAFLAEAVFLAATGHQFKMSTEARVTPDGLRN